MALQGVQHGADAAAERRRRGLRRERSPEPEAPPIDEGDRRRRYGRDGASPVAAARSGCQPSPGDSARLARGVEPRRLVALEPSRQDLRLPRPRWRFEPFQHRKHLRQRVRSFEARVAVDMLPVEQKAEEIRAATGSISARKRFMVRRCMRATKRRSHHCSSLTPGMKRPRRMAPSASSAASAAASPPAQAQRAEALSA